MPVLGFPGNSSLGPLSLNERRATMPSSAVHTFTDPDGYVAAMRAATPKLLVSARGNFDAKHTRIDLHHLWMQRFSDNLPRVLHVDHVAGRAIVTFGTQPRSSLMVGGAELHPSAIVRHCEAQSYYQRSSGPTSFGAMSLPVQEMISVVAAMAGCDLTPPHDPLLITPPPVAMARLQRLHAAAGRLAEEAPEIIANPEAAHGLEQSLIQAMVGCLGTGDVQEDRAARRQHDAIMRRFHAVLEANLHQVLYLPGLCAAIGVTHRTLLRCCHEQLGMGPNRFLLLRRMHLARRALREADAATTTVARIATQSGFWELGRFAVEYRYLFGESPSCTLRRPPEYRREPAVGLPRILAEIA
jgi:AraC-like DNA-binding protein